MMEIKKSSSKQKSKLEVYADAAHKSWSGWMKYLFEKSILNDDGTVTILKPLVDRWKRQMETPHDDLSEKEKESDRVEARKYLEID